MSTPNVIKIRKCPAQYYLDFECTYRKWDYILSEWDYFLKPKISEKMW